MQDDASHAERDVPVVGLMEVVVQPHDAALLTVGTVRLDHLPPEREPLSPVCLDEAAAVIGADHRLDDVDIRDGLRPGVLGGGHEARLLQVDAGVVTHHEAAGPSPLPRPPYLDPPAPHPPAHPPPPRPPTPL